MLIDGVDMLPGRAPFPRNHWYVAAFGFEVTREPLHRMLFGDPVVLYRTEAGEPVALFDRCPHRGMRLSNGGKLVGDAIQCNYHGIQFAANGRACLIPSGGAPTSAMAVHRYPLVEIGGWIWAWAGDPALADVSRIPDHEEIGLTRPGYYAYYGARLEAHSNYLYSIENLVDATHITFLHHGLIDDGNVASHPVRVEQKDARVSVIREFENEIITPMLAATFRLTTERADRTLELTSYAPNMCIVRNEVVEAGGDQAARRDNRLVFGITPAGPKSTHQFVAVANNFENTNERLFEDLRFLLMEDVVAMDDIQKLFDELDPDRVPEVAVRSDEGSIRTRRIIAAQIAEEHRQPVAAE